MSKGGKREGAGRPKGSTNKLQQNEVDALVAEYGITPLKVMFELMADKDSDNKDRLDCAKAAAPYVHRKMPIEADVTSNGNTLIWNIVE